jgi:hypothetical protein
MKVGSWLSILRDWKKKVLIDNYIIKGRKSPTVISRFTGNNETTSCTNKMKEKNRR